MKQSENPSQLSTFLEAAIVVWLFVFAAFAPHSIAVAQGAWLIGTALWLLRLLTFPKPKTWRTPVDYALLGFFILSGISSVLSYEPLVSIGKMRAASLFLIFYLFVENIPSKKVARGLALTLVASCLINVFYTAATRVIGRGVKIEGVKAESPLALATISTSRKTTKPWPIVSGDTLLAVDGEPVRNAEELVSLISSPVKGPTASVKMYRGDVYPPLLVPRDKLLPGATPEERLGIASWHIGRDWRASGFYGHYVTYAESLQLIASVALGLFICLPLKKSRTGALLLFALAGIIFALLLTVTRASWLAFLISAGTMFLLSASRRMVLIAFACAIPLVVAGALLLQQKRHVGLFDKQDASTTWRETVWREGTHLLISNPRHLAVGVGMDSIKRHWREWGLFDNGNIPLGHMHSNVLQIALERGLPTLIVWLLLLVIYARTLWQALRKQTSRSDKPDESAKVADTFLPRPVDAASSTWSALNAWLHQSDWIDRGIILSALGGLLGFLTSGLVHYNWGDSEVVMIFYFMMGLSLRVARNTNIRIGSL